MNPHLPQWLMVQEFNTQYGEANENMRMQLQQNKHEVLKNPKSLVNRD